MTETIDDKLSEEARSEFSQQYLSDNKIYSLPQRVAYKLGLGSKEAAAATIGKVTYSLVVGTGLDYFTAGLRGWGIVSSRTSATGINTVTGIPYDKWRKGWYKLTRTPEKTSSFRKWLVELGAFNTFETYVYGVSICAGSLAEKGSIDFWDVQSGVEGLILWSLVIAPTMGKWLNLTCKLFGVESAAKRAEDSPP